MRKGDVVCWRGRRWVIRGFTPAGLPEHLVELEEISSGEWARARLEELEPGDGGAVLPLRPRKKPKL